MPQIEISKLFKRGSIKHLLWLICILLIILFGYFVYRYKMKKPIIFEHYADRLYPLELWIQSSPNVKIEVYYTNTLIPHSSIQNGRVYQYAIPNVVSNQKVYIHCKKSQSIVSTQGTYIICKYRFGSNMYYSNRTVFKFEGIKSDNGSIIKDKYIGCFPSQSDGKITLTNITGIDKLTRAQCRNLAIKQKYQYYALNNGGTCAIANTGYDRYGGDTNISNCQMPFEKNNSERCG